MRKRNFYHWKNGKTMKQPMRITLLALLCIGMSLFSGSPLVAQKKTAKAPAAPAAATPKPGFDESLYNSIKWRHIGPFRGGRSAAVTG
ncbi:MAG: hypothetical protein RL181_1896, partial [Bacteroidota bacterium]